MTGIVAGSATPGKMRGMEPKPLEYATDQRCWNRYKVLMLIAGVLMVIGLGTLIYGFLLSGLN